MALALAVIATTWAMHAQQPGTADGAKPRGVSAQATRDSSGGTQYAQQVLGASTSAGQSVPAATPMSDPTNPGLDPRLVILVAWLPLNLAVVAWLHRRRPASDHFRPMTLVNWRNVP